MVVNIYLAFSGDSLRLHIGKINIVSNAKCEVLEKKMTCYSRSLACTCVCKHICTNMCRVRRGGKRLILIFNGL